MSAKQQDRLREAFAHGIRPGTTFSIAGLGAGDRPRDDKQIQVVRISARASAAVKAGATRSQQAQAQAKPSHPVDPERELWDRVMGSATTVRPTATEDAAYAVVFRS